MKKRITRALLLLVAGFLIFFTGRLIYGFIITSEGNYGSGQQQEYYYSEEDGGFNKKNYASSKTEYKGEKQSADVQTYDQKYEKTGTLKSRSPKFEESEKKARTAINSYGGVIQFEQKSGLAGSRSLKLVIGVPPVNFDSLVASLRDIGKLLSVSINKVDKTNEYKNLKAQRTTLEKTIASLYSLKTKSGNVDEFINLENRIMELEKELQDLGVALGEFDEVNEFCTVRYTLNEREEKTDSGISMSHRIAVALDWSIRYYMLFLLSIGGFLMIAWFGVKTFDLLGNIREKGRK